MTVGEVPWNDNVSGLPFVGLDTTLPCLALPLLPERYQGSYYLARRSDVRMLMTKARMLDAPCLGHHIDGLINASLGA